MFKRKNMKFCYKISIYYKQNPDTHNIFQRHNCIPVTRSIFKLSKLYLNKHINHTRSLTQLYPTHFDALIFRMYGFAQKKMFGMF